MSGFPNRVYFFGHRFWSISVLVFGQVKFHRSSFGRLWFLFGQRVFESSLFSFGQSWLLNNQRFGRLRFWILAKRQVRCKIWSSGCRVHRDIGGSAFSQSVSLAFRKVAQQSVQPTGGTRPDLQAFFCLRAFFLLSSRIPARPPAANAHR